MKELLYCIPKLVRYPSYIFAQLFSDKTCFMFLNPFCCLQKGKRKPVHVVDVPGHSRLRPKVDEYLSQAAGIVFVVDAVEFLPNLCAASEYVVFSS